ncbi:hypothetical protein K491DRAFT_299178 [Lophiostoma macrostomum CBS 122681]|uniref:Uncharacterized protein n=1 Tax=Lophiostoma macrostomum CBS 122681 TaxID=1314788 RepID=A0A6A6SJH2_9PLEO|nr:hypothetical protein K491DRAFT_299178 [Lophiostoma macrostomum CBS 122681]
MGLPQCYQTSASLYVFVSRERLPFLRSSVHYCVLRTEMHHGIFGACMQTGTLVDKSCFCTDKLSERGCSACSDSRNRPLYLSWLNSTCGDIAGWQGLSNNWTSELPELKLVWVGNATAKSNSYYASSDNPCSYKAPSTYQYCNTTYFPNWNRPPVLCSALGINLTVLWKSNIYNATEAAMATFRDANKTYSPWFRNNYYAPQYWASKYDPSYDPGLYLDLNGFCRSIYPATGGNGDTCGSPAERSRRLLWAGSACTPTPYFGWPENWKDSLALVNSTFKEKSSLPPLRDVPGTQSCSSYINSTLNRCTSQRCKDNTCSEFVDAVDIPCLCKDMDVQAKCNTTGIERTVDYLWFNSTCGSFSGFPGLPAAWENSLLTMNSSYGAPKNFSTWPDCANVNACKPILNGTVTNCTQTLCDIDPQTGVCNSTSSGVKPLCFCSPLNYDHTCNQNCKLSWEREQYLHWMNSTSIPDSSWRSLPGNWVDLLQVQDYELLPWNWRIQITATKSQNSTVAAERQQHCPSTSSKLAAFAAVNAAMALLIPLFGRRDVMKKITFGFFGKRASPMWLATGPLTVILHVASNAIAALMIKQTPGFGSVDVGQLILLWCTRPRLAWMIIALIPFQASNEIYFSVASSTLIAEVFLQILGGCYMGVATNYARRQKWYQVGHLTRTARGRDAMVMYAGSIMWLSVIVIAIATCVWSLLGLSRFVAAIAGAIRGLDRQARRHAKSLEKRAAAVAGQRDSSVKPSLIQGLAVRFYSLDVQFEQSCGIIYQNLTKLSDRWVRLEKYATTDLKAMRAAEQEASARKKKAKAEGKAQSPSIPRDAAVSWLKDSLAYATWNNTPAHETFKVRAMMDKFSTTENWVRETKTSIETEITATERNLQGYRNTLLTVEERIRIIEKVIQHFSTWNTDQPGRARRGIFSSRSRANDENAYIDALLRGTTGTKWTPSASERSIISSFRTARASFAQIRTELIGPDRDPVGNNSRMGLNSLISDAISELRCLMNWRASISSFIPLCAVVKHECTKLTNIWTQQKAKREAEDARRGQGSSALLRKIALRTIAGMIGCSAAQWVWWVGNVKVAGDR